MHASTPSSWFSPHLLCLSPILSLAQINPLVLISSEMGVLGKTRSALTLPGKAINEILSFIVFSFLDILDVILCYVYKIADFFIEAEWKPCYCSPAKEAITSSGKILVSKQSETNIVSLTSTKLQLEEISDTLYVRPTVVSDVSR